MTESLVAAAGRGEGGAAPDLCIGLICMLLPTCLLLPGNEMQRQATVARVGQ
jgi:hypothetical protein